MTLQELGQEYITNAENLKNRARVVSRNLRNLDGIRLYEANRTVQMLNDMAQESRTTGLYLINYYDHKATGRVYHNSK